MALSWDQLGTSVALNGGVALGVFFIFNYLRRISFLADFYAAKRKLSIPFRFRPPRLPPTLFSWMKPVFLMPDPEFVAVAGFDALAYVKFLALATRMCFWVTIAVGIIVLPTNWAGGKFVDRQLSRQDKINAELLANATASAVAAGLSSEEIQAIIAEPPTVQKNCGSDTDVDETAGVVAASGIEEDPMAPEAAKEKPSYCDDVGFVVANFDETSMTNIDSDDDDQINLLWAHIVALWVVFFIVIKMLGNHWHESLKWRILYLAWKRKGDSAHTVLVTDIPGTPHGTPIGRLYDNIDGTIGRFLPQSIKDKIQYAMKHGISSVTGKVKGKVGKVGDKVSNLTGQEDIFRDRNLYVYRRISDGFGKDGGERFADAMSGVNASFSSATESPNDSFMSANAVFQTPRGSLRRTSSVLSAALSPNETSGVGDNTGPLAPYPPVAEEVQRPPIAARRNLKNFKFRKAHTDFQVWEQAEAALQHGASVEQLVHREFSSDFGASNVQKVTVVRNELRLGKIKALYEKKRLALEELTDKWISMLRRKKPITRKQVTVKPNKNDPARTAKWGSQKTTADEMEFKLWDLQDQLEKLKNEQAVARKQETSAAFVTLSRRLHQTTVSTGLLSFREDLWCAGAAPDPNEVIWGNVSWRGWERLLRLCLSWGIFVLLIVFMIPIVLFISQLVNLNAYAEQEGDKGAWARAILRLPFVSQVLPGIMPTLGLKIFLALVPIVLRLSALWVQGLNCQSAVDFEVGRKYYIFQFIIVFIFLTLTSSASSGASSEDDDSSFPIVALGKSFADKPETIPTWIGTALPQQASFYLQYVLTNGILAKGIAFLRLPGAAIYFILSRFLAGTKRQKKKCWSNQYMSYGPDVADHSITLLLMLAFGVLQPFMPLVCLVYFICNYFYARYDLLYTQREAFQSGGLFWPVIFDQVYLGVIVMLLGYFALFSIKSFPIGTTLTIPLIIIAIVFRASVAKQFRRPMENLSIHAAADLDRADDQSQDWMWTLTPEEERQMRDAEWDLEDVKLGPPEERYTQPSLLVNEYLHSRIVQEAREVSQRVDALMSGENEDAQGDFMLEEDSDGSDHDTGREHVYSTGPVLIVGSVPLAGNKHSDAV